MFAALKAIWGKTIACFWIISRLKKIQVAAK
jgi:hypothetical protein